MSHTFTLPIQNMTCGGCAARVGRVLDTVQGAGDVRVNFAAETAQITVSDMLGLETAVAALDSAGYPTQQDEVRLSISGMSCASCVGRLRAALEAQAGVLEAQVNLVSETATLRYVRAVTTPKRLAQIATDAGYPASVPDAEDLTFETDSKLAEIQEARQAVLVAALLTIPVFVLEMGGHIFPAFHHLIARTIGHEVSWVIQFVLTTLVLLGPGRRFFTSGVPALMDRVPTMNSLVALGAGAAWTFSTVALWLPSVLPQGTRVVYFEAAAVIVTLILLGRWFEARAKGQTGAAIQRLIGLTPTTAKLRQGTDWIDTPVADLHVGDIILVQPGARIPTDAEVAEGTSYVDESMLTGEPQKISKTTGDVLTGGSVNGHGSLICNVTRTGTDTTLASIIQMVQNAQGARLPIQALVDRVTLWFVPAVICVAMVTLLVWLVFGASLSHALVAAVSVLIIACPCAMGLATPTSIMVGTGRAAEQGVLFRQGDALQSLSDVRVVAFDKTGTLTLGQPTLTRIECAQGFETKQLLALFAAVEQHSEHPLADAVLAAQKDTGQPVPAAAEIEIAAGFGIKGACGGKSIAIGNADLMQSVQADTSDFDTLAKTLRQEGQSVFFGAVDGQIAALFAVSDPVRQGSIPAISALKAAGLRVTLITGDALGTAQAVSAKLDLDHVTAQVLPAEKVTALQQLRSKYGPIAFVGDGINDAPVLAEADVGIAIGTGTDVAIETADVVLMSGDPQGVLRAFEMSRHTLRNIRQNLIWAFGYNVLLIPVAAGALYPGFGLLLSPGLAAGAMAFSSVFVLGNALRLRQVGG